MSKKFRLGKYKVSIGVTNVALAVISLGVEYVHTKNNPHHLDFSLFKKRLFISWYVYDEEYEKILRKCEEEDD